MFKFKGSQTSSAMRTVSAYWLRQLCILVAKLLLNYLVVTFRQHCHQWAAICDQSTLMSRTTELYMISKSSSLSQKLIQKHTFPLYSNALLFHLLNSYYHSNEFRILSNKFFIYKYTLRERIEYEFMSSLYCKSSKNFLLMILYMKFSIFLKVFSLKWKIKLLRFILYNFINAFKSYLFVKYTDLELSNLEIWQIILKQKKIQVWNNTKNILKSTLNSIIYWFNFSLYQYLCRNYLFINYIINIWSLFYDAFKRSTKLTFLTQ